MPELIKLSRRHDGDDLVVLGVSDESASIQRRFARRKRVPYPLLVQTQRLPRSLSSGGMIPATFIIDRNGKIRDKQIGYRKGAVEDAVAKVLGE